MDGIQGHAEDFDEQITHGFAWTQPQIFITDYVIFELSCHLLCDGSQVGQVSLQEADTQRVTPVGVLEVQGLEVGQNFHILFPSSSLRQRLELEVIAARLHHLSAIVTLSL